MNRGWIEVSLYASLRKWSSVPKFRFEVPETCTVRDVLLGVGIPVEDAAIIMVNRKRGEPDSPVSAGDTLDLFPLIGGG